MSSKGAEPAVKYQPGRAIRVGVIGAGVMGSNHARVLAGLPGVSLVGIVDPSPAHRTRATELTNCPSFETLGELFAEGVDAVTVAAPTHLHHEVALACIAHNIHVLVEKPIASSVEEGRQIVAAANRAGVTLMVGHVERFNPAVAAIKEAITAVRNAAHMPFAEALAEERAIFQRLRESEEAAALRYLFFAERQAARVADLGETTTRPIAQVGIVGAGTMGAAIAVCFLDAGLPVSLVERDAQSLERGVDRVRAVYQRLSQTGRITAQEMERRLARLTSGVGLDRLSQVDLVIEAVFEDMDLKKGVFRDLDGVLKPGAVLASNTSYLDLDALAAATRRPSDCVGLHFFSPANVMRLLEIVRGRATASDVLATTLAVAKTIRKLPVVARVGEGFIGNRIYSAYRTQCELMLEEGAYPAEVDTALVAFGLAMGPFAVGDLSGLDIAWRTRQRLAATRDPKARHPEILDRLCELGRFGQKTGAGWYRYAEGARRGQSDPEVHALIEKVSQEKGIARRPFTAEQIQWRALAAMINEAALLLAEGIAARPSDVDLVLVNGYGFPAHKGGPLFWASRRERKDVVAALDALAAASGDGLRRGNVEKYLEEVAGQ